METTNFRYLPGSKAWQQTYANADAGEIQRGKQRFAASFNGQSVYVGKWLHCGAICIGCSREDRKRCSFDDPRRNEIAAMPLGVAEEFRPNSMN